MVQLFDWQKPLADSVEAALAKHNLAILAAATGTGKTYVAGEVARRLRTSKCPLVLCPKSIISSWRSVLDGFGLVPYDVLNWEKIKTGKTQWLKGVTWHLPFDTLLIVDEAHKGCSGPNTQTGEALARLKAYGLPILMTSATMASSPLQMRHTGYLLGLHAWNRDSWVRWLTDNKCWYDRDNKYWRSPKGRAGREVMQGINRRIGDKLIYCSHADIPGFPETQVQAKLYDLDSRSTEEIRGIWDAMSWRMKQTGKTDLAELGKSRERTEMLKTQLLCDLCLDALEQEISPVVFLNFKEPLFHLRQLLTDKGVTGLSCVYGGQDSLVRDAEVARFQADETQVCLATSGAGGVGISLHDTTRKRPRIAYINPSYNASDTKQCLGRIHRAGGTPSVQIFPLAANTAEERVYRAIQHKLGCIDQLNDADLVLA